MDRILITLVTSGFVLTGGLNTAVAQDDDDRAAAVEIYACSYADGKGTADLDKVIAKWNKWADGQGKTDYSEWTMTSFYSGPEQDFDFIWVGVTKNGKSMGATQDTWLAKGGALEDDFDSVAPCDAHSMSAALQFKAPPKREEPSRVVLDFSDCTIGDGKHFSTDVAPALIDGRHERQIRNGGRGPPFFCPPRYQGGCIFASLFRNLFASCGNQ